MKIRRSLAAGLCLCLVLALTACTGAAWLDDLSDEIRSLGQRQPNGGILSVHQLIQKIADAMKDDTSIITVYEGIPERQKDGLALDQFQQYIRFLRKGVSGTISSFSEMTESDISTIRSEIGSQLPELAGSTETLSGFWLHYQAAGRSEERFAIYIREQEGQPPDLYGDWVRQILDLQDLALLYFDALDRYDRDALAVLLQPQDFPEDIIIIRADRLIRFYRYNITSRSSEFKVTQARIDRIGFEAFGIINPDQSQAVSRRIEMIRQPDGSYVIDDILPEVIDEDDLRIYFQDMIILQIGLLENGEPVQVRSGDLESIIGPPVVHDDTVCVTAANGIQRISLAYASLELKAEGSCFRHSRWNGLVTQIRLTASDCRIGSGLSPGDSLADLLRQYPFAREAGYMIHGRTGNSEVTLRFIVQDDRIEAIELTLK